MAKIKLNTYNGLTTNYDQNDTKLDLFPTSINWRHENGFIQFEPRSLSSYALPDIDTDNGDSAGTWEWVKGIYAILTNDRYKLNPVASQNRVLILVGRKLVTATYTYDVYLKDIDSGSWIRLITNSFVDQSLLQTSLNKDIKLVPDRGIVRLYLPHDVFWIGKIDRDFADRDEYNITYDSSNTIYSFDTTRATKSYSIPDGYYIERAVEIITDDSFNGAKLTLNSNKISIADNDMRLRAMVNVEPVSVTNADDKDIYKFTTVLRTPAGAEPGYYYWFQFFKLDVHGNPIQPATVATGVIAGPDRPDNRYAEASTGAGTISPNSAAYPNGDSRRYNNDFKQLPPTYDISYPTSTSTDKTYYDTENVANNLIVYYDTKVAKEPFVGPTDWLVTGTLDRTTEIVMEHGTISQEPTSPSAPTNDEKYYLNFKIKIPDNINVRLTDIKLYARPSTYDDEKDKWVPDVDYMEVLNLDLLLNKDSDNISLYKVVAKSDSTGVLLSQNIGIVYDPSYYKIITGFKDYVIESGIGLGISNDDDVNIYYSVVGGGVLQSDLVYPQNILDLPGVAFVNAMASINGNIAAITDTSTYIIRSSESAGVLAFAIQKTLPHGVKDRNDVAELPGGVALHTRNGIYITNGYEPGQRVSEKINDIVLANYSTGIIKYNEKYHELYYTANVTNSFYRYRFERNVWEEIILINPPPESPIGQADLVLALTENGFDASPATTYTDAVFSTEFVEYITS